MCIKIREIMAINDRLHVLLHSHLPLGIFSSEYLSRTETGDHHCCSAYCAAQKTPNESTVLGLLDSAMIAIQERLMRGFATPSALQNMSHTVAATLPLALSQQSFFKPAAPFRGGGIFFHKLSTE